MRKLSLCNVARSCTYKLKRRTLELIASRCITVGDIDYIKLGSASTALYSTKIQSCLIHQAEAHTLSLIYETCFVLCGLFYLLFNNCAISSAKACSNSFNVLAFRRSFTHIGHSQIRYSAHDTHYSILRGFLYCACKIGPIF